jgi:hypothetical protein
MATKTQEQLTLQGAKIAVAAAGTYDSLHLKTSMKAVEHLNNAYFLGLSRAQSQRDWSGYEHSCCRCFNPPASFFANGWC